LPQGEQAPSYTCLRSGADGLTADNCVLYTASDAHLHDFELFLPVDCVVSINDADKEAALTKAHAAGGQGEPDRCRVAAL